MTRRTLHIGFFFVGAISALVVLAFGCGRRANEGGTVAVAGAEKATEQIYDLEIVLEGLIGFVPVGADGKTAGAGDTAATLWGLMVNATDPANLSPPCLAYAPAKDSDEHYHQHFPVLRFDSKNADPGIETETTLKGFQLEIEHSSLTGEGVELSGKSGEPCSAQNDESFACVAEIAKVQEYLAPICTDCVASLAKGFKPPEEVGARIKLSDGLFAAKFNNPGDLKQYYFPANGKFKNGKWEWDSRVDDSLTVPLADSHVVTVKDLQGPVTLKLQSLNNSADASTISLSPVEGETLVRIQVLNQTCEALGTCQPMQDQPYSGREFRWYYLLSRDRPVDNEACMYAKLPSLAIDPKHAFETRPICPSAVFQSPGG